MTVHNLALEIYDALQPNAPLSAIEKRVWMLKCRNLSDNTVFDILKQEYSPDTEYVRKDDNPLIVVESLPDEYKKADWT